MYAVQNDTEIEFNKVLSTEPRFSGGHVTVFLEFQKWPSPVTNVPKQQPNSDSRQHRLKWPTDRPPRVELPDSLITRQVDLCAAVGAVTTDAYIQVDSQQCRQMWMEGRN